jgi:hypothetical protein
LPASAHKQNPLTADALDQADTRPDFLKDVHRQGNATALTHSSLHFSDGLASAPFTKDLVQAEHRTIDPSDLLSTLCLQAPHFWS